MKALKDKEQLQKTVELWNNSSKHLFKLVDSSMSPNCKVGLGYEITSNSEVLSYEEVMEHTVFVSKDEDFVDKPIYNTSTSIKWRLYP